MLQEPLLSEQVQKSLLWLLAHIGSVTAVLTLLFAWWRRKGRLHLRGLRPRVRHMAIDCLRWAVTHRLSPSRLYWGLRYFHDWEMSETVREGLRVGGLPVDDPEWRRQLAEQLGLAVQTDVFRKFDDLPTGIEVRTPMEDMVDECRRIMEVADEAEDRGLGAVAEVLRAKIDPSSETLMYQVMCDLWVQKTRAVALNQVLHQASKLVERLELIKADLSSVPSQLTEIRGDLTRLDESSRLVRSELATVRDNSAQTDTSTPHSGASVKALWWARLAVGLLVWNFVVIVVIGCLIVQSR